MLAKIDTLISSLQTSLVSHLQNIVTPKKNADDFSCIPLKHSQGENIDENEFLCFNESLTNNSPQEILEQMLDITEAIASDILETIPKAIDIIYDEISTTLRFEDIPVLQKQEGEDNAFNLLETLGLSQKEDEDEEEKKDNDDEMKEEKDDDEMKEEGDEDVVLPPLEEDDDEDVVLPPLDEEDDDEDVVLPPLEEEKEGDNEEGEDEKYNK